ncbi:MAG: prepilin-type N-terminal cleavage/methylation domain-containing protein [Armatimonadetes bacterium]|nr:prepilin-type N-terminal cleavage/methylation domain-containing protein [Armatimonadota bacterium]
MTRSRGFTLVEALVAVALVGIVLLVVDRVLVSTSRLTRAQTQRSLQQTRLQAVAGQVEKTLLGCRAAGVSWQRSASPDAGILAAHAYQSGSFTADPRWEPFWRCFVWDASSGRLYLTQSPTSGSFPIPSEARPQAMTPAEMDGLLQATLPGPNLVNGRLLAQRVTDFRFSLVPGPLFRIEIEVDVPAYDAQETTAAARLRVVKLIHPRV